MSISLGGLGLLSVRNPFKELVQIVLGKGDLRFMFCLIVFGIVTLVLAYLTNPSENSFRAYLTEQSFRLHLSRLDDTADDNSNSKSPQRSSSQTQFNPPLFAADATPSFHFANRASIALRTPKHVFHSFAIFTIAAMVPLSKSSERENRDGWMISDSWYIGAFGKWWRGGVFEAWYQDVIARTKDEESWSSGILSMKRLDMLQDYNGPTFSAKNLPSHLSRGSPPRLRNRDRPALRNGAGQPRSSTPPPLPKSASLPMHTTRKSSSNTTERLCDHPAPVQPQAHALLNDSPRRNGAAAPSRTSSALFEHSPIIAEILRQISSTKTSVLDLRTQLTDCEAAAAQSRAVLQHEVDTHRNRKRQEDAAKLELKSRTKALEDSKRGAESTKKDAEKKLKAAQSFRDGATQRVDFLNKEILRLQQNLAEDRDFIKHHKSEISDVEREISENLEQKRLEIKKAEDLLLILNHRSRELEDKLATERQRLQALREQSEKLRQSRTSPVAHAFPQEETWVSNLHSEPGFPPGLAVDGWEPPFVPIRQSSSGADDRDSSRIIGSGTTVNGQNLSYSGHPPYMPFNERPSPENIETPSVHVSKAKEIPIPFVVSMESATGVSKSFQSDSDSFIDKEWRASSTSSYPSHYQNDDFEPRFPVLTSSPVSLHGQSVNHQENSAYNSRYLSVQDYAQDQQFVQSMDMQSWAPSDSELNTSLDSLPEHSPQAQMNQSVSRRWFGGLGSKTKSPKGLNPDAKEFNLFRKPIASPFTGILPTHKSFDALNPNGLGTISSSSTSSTLLRAFAPSPAEREALQRALGGSTNTSFERLPSLSDVGSIPPSPTNGHTLSLIPQRPGKDFGSILPAWLQALPTRKANFSPWDDEEPVLPGSKDSTTANAQRT
ncbi:hypothetical protein JR316_0002225 [Psilocybe cubensis]|uniref:Uncharacterized protein n=2 Tax=Psilocybe cubensis TaxID=181762 RepID=A0A8H7Y7K1_PSICU|nr:hypothetical protein JR316_0002225 [Psilocybe cubensis]KAH9485317.1 hypothetical protein JR316_0002225 [Psilocybe cubensis]